PVRQVGNVPITRGSRTKSPQVPADARQSPQDEVRNALLTPQIPTDPRSDRKRHARPVTPEVAGSSPVAPAEVPPGSRRESHPPAPTDPHVSLSTHTARTIRLQDSAVRYLQCANSSGFRVWTPRSHTRALLALRASRLYFHRAQRIRWRSMCLPSG